MEKDCPVLICRKVCDSLHCGAGIDLLWRVIFCFGLGVLAGEAPCFGLGVLAGEVPCFGLGVLAGETSFFGFDVLAEAGLCFGFAVLVGSFVGFEVGVCFVGVSESS